MVIGIDASRANVEQRTGVENYAWHIIHELLPLLGDHQVRLYTREKLQPDWGQLDPGIEVKVLHWAPKLLWTQLRLSWEMIIHRPDVLFIPAGSIPLFHPTRTFTTIHDIAFERWPKLYQHSVWPNQKWSRILLRLARIVTGGHIPTTQLELQTGTVRQALKTCPAIFAVSEFTKHEIVALYHYAPENISVTTLAAEPSAHYERLSNESLARTRNLFRLNEPYFMFVGRLEEKKNINAILKAYQYYHQQNYGPEHLVLVGNRGDGWPTNYIEDHKLSSCVHELGWQPSAVVAQLLVGARALIFVSRYEGFGLPVLEALSAGIPVLASRQGAIMEVAADSAVYTDPEDQTRMAQDLRLINSDATLRQRLVTTGKNRAAMFSWKKSAIIVANVLTNKHLLK